MKNNTDIIQMNLLRMNPMKFNFKYKNEILLFFIVVFGLIIVYHGLGKLCNKKSIIEGVTTKKEENKSNAGKADKADKDDTIEIKQMKQKLKILDNTITKKVEPSLNKFLEKVTNVSNEINQGIKDETVSKLNTFSDNNKKSTSVSKQDKVPPFSASEINNAI
jgi:hypothetical protein